MKRGLLLGMLAVAAAMAAGFPPPVSDAADAAASHKATAVVAGGCFWGVEGVFERLRGVSDVVSGFAGGKASTAHYEIVSSGNTGHAESVKITYDPSQISYGRLLQVFFSVAHDPTQLNHQGADQGTQYRSAIFYSTEEQKRVAEAYIAQLDQAHVFRGRIVTQVVPLSGFYAAEEYHQHFLDRNPDNPYIMNVDMPKIEALRQEYPDWLKKKK